MTSLDARPRIAIACGGTGGHLYPGMAVAEQLLRRGCAVTALISSKDVDQQAIQSIAGVEVATLPAVGLTRGRYLSFISGFIRSYRKASRTFQAVTPHAVLAMGGFTSAPPLLAGRRLGSRTFLHESNAVPGRANRWLSWVVDRAFIGFASAAGKLHSRDIVVTGTPVRDQFQLRDPVDCRTALGLDPGEPVVLVMGGSQGASGLNRLVTQTLPQLREKGWQWLHLTGNAEFEQVQKAYSALNVRAVVHRFLNAMELALGASTVAISRAGASSLAELSAMRLPAVLVPYPAAVDNHQFFNAKAFEQTNAARLLQQHNGTPHLLASLLTELVENTSERQKIKGGLERWHSPSAAANIAENILQISRINAPRPAKNSVEQANPYAENQGSFASLPGQRPPDCGPGKPPTQPDQRSSQQMRVGRREPACAWAPGQVTPLGRCP